MDKEELQVRIQKCDEKIKKIEKRIAKWSIGLAQEHIEAAQKYEKYSAFLDYCRYTEIPQSEDWNKGPNIEELRSAFIDLKEANNIKNKYQAKLDEILNYEQKDKIEILVKFLADWRAHTYAWYLDNCKKYFELKKGYNDAYKEFKAKFSDKIMTRNDSKTFCKSYYRDIDPTTMLITNIEMTYVWPDKENKPFVYYYVPSSYSVDEEKLNKLLDEEVKAKYEDLVNRITEVAGVILDASHLYIAENGQINGYVTGSKSKVRIETISAGGYNIQKFHYRCLVHEVKRKENN